MVDAGAQVAGRNSSFGIGVDGKTINFGSIVEEGAIFDKIDDWVYAPLIAPKPTHNFNETKSMN